jgi:hypothetical protein
MGHAPIDSAPAVAARVVLEGEQVQALATPPFAMVFSSVPEQPPDDQKAPVAFESVSRLIHRRRFPLAWS